MAERDAARDALLQSLITEGISVLAMLLVLVALRKGHDIEQLVTRLRHRQHQAADRFERDLRAVQREISRMEHEQ